MKSIKQWMMENQMGQEMGMSNTQELGLAKQFQGGVKVKSTVANILKSPLKRAMQALEGEDPTEVLKEIMAIVIRQVFDIHRTTVTPSMIRKVLDEIENEKASVEEESPIDKEPSDLN